MSENNVELYEYTKKLIGVEAQKQFLLKLVEKKETLCGTSFSQQCWKEFTKQLNQLGGVTKNFIQWRHSFYFIHKKYKNKTLNMCTEKKLMIEIIKNAYKLKHRNENQVKLNKRNSADKIVCRPCKESDASIQEFKEGGKSCIQIILQVSKHVIYAHKTDLDALRELCSGKSTFCKRIPIWRKMQISTIFKLNCLLNAQDIAMSLPEEERLNMREWLMFDTVIVHQDVNVISMAHCICVHVSDMPILWDLFALVNEFNVENLSGDKLAEAWFSIALAYNMKNRLCTPMLLQRRWYQMKEATMNAINQNKDLESSTNDSPSELQTAIAEKYPSLTTDKFVVWEDLIKQKRVVLREQLEQIAMGTADKSTGKSFDCKTTDKDPLSLTTVIHDYSDNSFDDYATNELNEEDEINNQEHILPDVMETISNVPNMSDTSIFIASRGQSMNLQAANSPVLPGVSNPVIPGVLTDDYSDNSFDDYATNELNEEDEINNQEHILPDVMETISNVPNMSDTSIFIAHRGQSMNLQASNSPVLPGVSNPVLRVQGVPNPVLQGVSNSVIPGVSDLDSTMESEWQTEIKVEPESRHDFDNLILSDYDIELSDHGSTDADLRDPFYGCESDLEERVSETQNADLEKIIKSPIVYTVKLQDMNLLPPNFTSIINNKQLIQKIYEKSKPMQRKPKKTSSKYGFKKHSISSAIFKKPYHRSYDLTTLFNNPDFNISLLNLKPPFFSIPKNRSLFNFCKPMTVDISKEFEKSLVDGIMYLKDDDSHDSSRTDTRKKKPTSLLGLNALKATIMKDVHEMIGNHDDNNFNQTTNICTANSSSSLMDTNSSTYLETSKAKTKRIKKPIFKIRYKPLITKSKRKKGNKTFDDVKTISNIAPKQTSNVINNIEPILAPESVWKPTKQCLNNVPLAKTTSVNITNSNQLPPKQKNTDVVTKQPKKRKKLKKKHNK